MPELEYLILFMLFFAVWASCFIIGGRSWQMTAAFIPMSIASFFYYDTNTQWNWLLLIPMLPVTVLDIHVVLSKPKFRGFTSYLNYLLIIPFLIVYFYNASNFKESETWLGIVFDHFFSCLIIIFVSKVWISNIVLLFVNRLWSADKNVMRTRLNDVYITGTGRTKTFNASIYQLGAVEISGFFYQYVRFKKIRPDEEIELTIKTGWLGTEYIAGFPKVLNRSRVKS
ncbi:hypothetical protein [Pedobacter namyangjuensis]|uniref:hypothetical protein n=1 Tax=Pedobacter namyangjuensis TaxID=600626 RepID=UPI000DE48B7E|nr:hypothetical protein [Pedobacter namyangjuensis]